MKKLIDKIFDKLGYIPKVQQQFLQIKEEDVCLLEIKQEITQLDILYFGEFSTDVLGSVKNKIVHKLLDEVSKYIVITEERDILSLVYKYSAYIRVIRSK